MSACLAPPGGDYGGAVATVSGSERSRLCDLMEALGPEAPTLCEGWTTSDLAAHLYIRERRPDAAAGMFVKPLAGHTTQTMAAVTRHLGYAGVVSKVRSGPPLLWRLIDQQINTFEYFIHHEDVRRAEEGSEPRVDSELDKVLWDSLKRGARLLARKVRGAGLELVNADGERITARAGEQRAVITGGPQELALYLYGRTSVARVTIEAEGEARAALDAADFGV
jgi:uncharacterized protein (TIGR03085 family)